MTELHASVQDGCLMLPSSLKIAALSLLLGLSLPLSPPLFAGQDWAHLRAVRVADSGHVEASLGVQHSVQTSWAEGDHFAYFREVNGDYRLQRVITAEVDLGWQWSPAWGAKLAVPYALTEVSSYPPYSYNYSLADSTVHRNDGVGDIQLELRRAWGVEPGLAGASAGSWLGVVGPSGLGPFEASHPLAATGMGRWQIEPGFVVGTSNGVLSVVAQVGAPLQLGREARIANEAALGYGPNGPLLPAPGAVWLGTRTGVEGGVGLAWLWYNAEDSRQTIAVECQAWQRSALDIDGVLQPDTENVGLRFVPQLHADFGRFKAMAAWELPFLYANNEAASDFGASHLRVDYGF